MSPSLPSPPTATSDPAQAFITYLDYFRAEASRKVADLDGADMNDSRLPTGWSPIELISHLVHMEQRWLVWGFLAEQVPEPWGDNVDGIPTGNWATDRPLEELLAALADVGRRTTEIVAAHDLNDHAATGGRFPDGEPTPTLIAILFHVMQEYARHVGHLDIVRELIDGTTGEG